MTPRTPRPQRDYYENIVPSMTTQQSQMESTFIQAELELDRHSLDVLFEPGICYGGSGVFGCRVGSQRYHFLIPWFEMKQRGFPSSVRTNLLAVIPLCHTCYLLYESRRAKTKQAWVTTVARDRRISPSKARQKYEEAKKILTQNLAPSIQDAMIYLHEEEKKIHTQHIQVNGDPVTSIDITNLKYEGSITVYSYRA